MPLFSEVLGLARFAAGLRAFGRDPIGPEDARRIVRERMRTREDRFLELLDRAVWPRARNPFRRLLEDAGATSSDVRSLVRSDGLEGALGRLQREGVFVTWEEFKGRADARRGSRTFRFRESDFDNPLIRAHYVGTSGGSLGPPVRVRVDLAFQIESAPDLGVWFAEQGWEGRPLVFWTPTHTGLANRYLMCAKIGHPYRQWFAMTDVRTVLDRMRSRAVHGLSQRILGFAAPVPADLAHAERVLEPLLRLRDRGERPLVNTSPSAAARLAQRAIARGDALEGVSFLLGAEPVTPERRASIEASGARAWPTYGTSESGWVGSQFEGAAEPDEVHVFRDAYAVVPRDSSDRDVSTANRTREVEPRAMLITTLLRAAPKLLVNTEIGDSACFVEAESSEPARRYGWNLTLHTIRSFRKLTAFGVTLAVSDLYPIVEGELPRRFGGRVGDFQLVESQDGAGISRLRLRVDPSVGPLDEGALREALLEAIGGKRSFYGMMADMLRKADALEIERRPAERTAAGKVLPVVPAPGRRRAA
jgi:hypothetical protein